MITCPKCGKMNRSTAKFCKHCGADISPSRGTPPTPIDRDTPPVPKSGTISELVDTVKHWMARPQSRSTDPGRRSDIHPPSPTSTRPLSPETPSPDVADVDHTSVRESGPTSAGISPITRPISPSEFTAPDATDIAGIDRASGVAPSSMPAAALQTTNQLRPLQRGSVLSHPHNSQLRYGIVTAHQLPRSIYYCAIDLTCTACGAQQSGVPTDGLCQQCQTFLQPVLIHERRPRPNGHLSDTDVEQLIQLSVDHPNIMPHRAIIQYQESVYTVVKYPGRWGPLADIEYKWASNEALAGTNQIGQALMYLHDRGFAHVEVGGASIESIIIVGDNNLKLTDLSACARLQPDDAQTLRAQVNSGVAFLAWLLFFLVTNKELSRTSIDQVPPALRSLVEQAMQEQYSSVQDMLNEFSLLPSPPTSNRSLKPSHGQATHPGQQRPHNEDAVVTFTFDKEQDGHSVPVGFYLVADGMGGHDAGDLASRTVNQTVTDWIIKVKVLPDLQKATHKLTTEDADLDQASADLDQASADVDVDMPGELLTHAIRQANKALLTHGQATGSDLGSTVTAALIIGDVATIANVGDSRTYLLRDKQLRQITRDHSLVARLVEAGAIGPQEMRTHPQRNQIYRCLGHRPDIKVDIFSQKMQAGDALVLCSDGLWEMVLDAQIQRIAKGALSPQKACDALVEAANREGGEDNIAVIVVRME